MMVEDDHPRAPASIPGIGLDGHNDMGRPVIFRVVCRMCIESKKRREMRVQGASSVHILRNHLSTELKQGGVADPGQFKSNDRRTA